MTIAITFGVSNPNFSVWSSGALQNVFFLYMLLKNIKNINVHLVNFGIPIDQINIDDIFNINEIEFTKWDDIKDDVDLFIEAGIKVNVEITKELRLRGAKIIMYRIGNAYILDNEDILFNKTNSEIYSDIYDEIWTLPHHEKTSKFYLEETYKCPIKILPMIWDTFFIDKYNLSLKQNNMNPYYEFEGWIKNKKNITIFEPNINAIKTCVYPMLIVERAYNKRPELFGKVRVLNAMKYNDNKKFVSFVNKLNIKKYGIATFEDRFNTPYILSQYTDIVVTTQWENELNYLYFDVLYNKYPLIHNSPRIKKAGYYYKDFDIETASEHLINCIIKDNSKLNDRRTNKLLNEFSIYNIKNITAYEEAILHLS